MHGVDAGQCHDFRRDAKKAVVDSETRFATDRAVPFTPVHDGIKVSFDIDHGFELGDSQFWVSAIKLYELREPLDPELPVFLNQYYTKAYLRHLIISKEILGAQIASIQNLTFYLWLMKQARAQIKAGTFASWKNEMVKKFMQRL